MSKTVEFFFDFGSPASYLAYKRLPDLIARAGAKVIYRPMLLGGVFKATGNAAPGTVPAKGAYTFMDLQRFAKKFATPIAMNPFFPINTISLMRGAAGFEGTDRFDAYLALIFEGMWRAPVNLGDPAVLAEALAAGGFDPDIFKAMIDSAEVKERLKATTGEAVARGAFGAPTFFVGEEMFFGQDRMDFVEDALRS